jgi:hypothetical protein
MKGQLISPTGWHSNIVNPAAHLLAIIPVIGIRHAIPLHLQALLELFILLFRRCQFVFEVLEVADLIRQIKPVDVCTMQSRSNLADSPDLPFPSYDQ